MVKTHAASEKSKSKRQTTSRLIFLRDIDGELNKWKDKWSV